MSCEGFAADAARSEEQQDPGEQYRLVLELWLGNPVAPSRGYERWAPTPLQSSWSRRDGMVAGSSERAPDAGAPVPGQHGQADGELGQTDNALEGDIPSWDIGGQDTGQLQDRHRDA
jgi:hypothetical protein